MIEKSVNCWVHFSGFQVFCVCWESTYTKKMHSQTGYSVNTKTLLDVAKKSATFSIKVGATSAQDNNNLYQRGSSVCPVCVCGGSPVLGQ